MSEGRSLLQQYVILDTKDGSYLTFKAMPSPESGYTDSKAVNWIPTAIIGRSSPLQGYANSQPRTVSIGIHLTASAEMGDNTTAEDVKKAALWLLSHAYPDYSAGITPPHTLMLVFGKQVKMRCVMSSCNIRYMGPWMAEGGLAYHAQVDCTFIEVDLIPKDYADCRGG